MSWVDAYNHENTAINGAKIGMKTVIDSIWLVDPYIGPVWLNNLNHVRQSS